MRLRLAEAPVRADRAGVGGNAPQVEAHHPELIPAVERAHGDERGTDPREVQHRVADVRGDADAIREHLAGVVVRDGDVVHLLTRVDRRGEAFGAVLAPAHRTAGDQREERDEALLAGEVLLVAEAAAGIRRHHAYRLLAQPAGLRDDRTELMRLLVRRVDMQDPGGGVDRGLRTVALEGQRGDAVIREPELLRVRRGREDLFEGRRQHGEPEELVRRPVGIQERCVGRERGQRIDHDRQRIVVDHDELQRVLRDRAARRDDCRDRFPDEPHPVAGEHAPFERLHTGQRQPVCHRPGAGGIEVGLGHDGHDTGKRHRRAHVDAQDPRVGARAAQDRDVAQTRDVMVGEVTPATAREPRVLAPLDAVADHAPLPATSSTASTIPE